MWADASRGELQAERAVDKGRIKQLDEQMKGTRFTGQSEYALTDGVVVASNGGEGTVTLNIGRKQRVVARAAIAGERRDEQDVLDASGPPVRRV